MIFENGKAVSEFSLHIVKREREIDMKRVYTLYRVSTVQQVDIVKDDIPMQRIACHEFAKRQGDWVIVKEFEEKGISGYKVSASKRDAIQDLKEAAMKNEFDILLVFMFDRLGRIEYETPFILQWFVEHGIEAWSVNEGQQKFENHVDKLTNYIRFWQASGESEKTSIRVKTRMNQMTSEGLYTGGTIPYGYCLVDAGRKNKKGKAMRDLAVDENEAAVVKMVFKMTIEQGYGSYCMAEYLNERGYTTHKNSPFQSNTILRMLKNQIYRGFLERGDAKSERIEALQIISDADFFKAQHILNQRANKSDEKRRIAMTNKGRALLSGNVFCAHCGCRLATSRYVERYRRSDGSMYEKEYGRYVCYHRSRGLNDCDGATTYIAEKIDEAIMKVMREIFANISGCPQEEKIEAAYRNMVANNHKTQQKLNLELQKNRTQLDALRLEIGKTLTGESVYDKEDLANMITVLRSKITSAEAQLEALKQEDAAQKAVSESIIPAYQQFKTWAEEFDSAPFEMKKMIANQLFSRVEIGKGYKIRLELDATFKTFCEEWFAIQNLEAAV